MIYLNSPETKRNHLKTSISYQTQSNVIPRQNQILFNLTNCCKYPLVIQTSKEIMYTSNSNSNNGHFNNQTTNFKDKIPNIFT